MNIQPILTTERLQLRPFTLDDAQDVQRLAGNKRIADTTANIPHPYLDGMAEGWINSHKPGWDSGQLCSYAIVLNRSDILIGAISIMDIADKTGELGYWIGVDYWGQGYCTEACEELMRFGFSNLGLHRLHAHHLSRNPASGRVLLKCGLKHIKKDVVTFDHSGISEEIECYDIVKY